MKAKTFKETKKGENKMENTTTKSNGNGTRFGVYDPTVTKVVNGKSFWSRVGTGFPNRDGSINVLVTLPDGTSKKYQVRELRQGGHKPSLPGDCHEAPYR